jgi:Rod binding domain-containing protein
MMTDFLPTIKQQIDPSSLLNAPKLTQADKDKLKKTAAEFEGMLMAQMFQALRKTVEPSGLFGNSQTERSTYDYLLDQAVIKNAIEGGQTWGLAARLEESWKNTQMKANASDEQAS